MVRVGDGAAECARNGNQRARLGVAVAPVDRKVQLRGIVGEV